MLLYWGATWCPPCNQLKATLFNRQEFAALSKNFVAVHVDGDRPGAQKLGSRFKVSGYPTTVLFTPEGAEITRLPGEVDPPQALAILQLGLSGGRPVKTVLGEALAGKALPANEWRMLAFYSWETDESQVVPKAELPALLARLAAASPAGDVETTTRLWLKTLAASDDGQGVKPDAALRERVLRVLADPQQARAQMDVLTNGAADIVRTLEAEDSPARAPLVAAFDTALKRLEADTTLSRSDRLGTLYARVELARLGLPRDAVQVKLPEPLLADLREHVASCRPRDHRRLRAPGRHHLRGQRPRPGRAVGRERRTAQEQPGQEPFGVLPDEPARQQRAQAGPQGRSPAVAGPGLRKERRPRHPAAVGCGLPGRAGRPGAAGQRNASKRPRRCCWPRQPRTRGPSKGAAHVRCSAPAPSSSAGTATASQAATMKRLQAQLGTGCAPRWTPPMASVRLARHC